MTRAQDDLQARARKRYQALRRKQRDPRFRKVMGRFVAEGLLATTIEGIPLHDKRVPLEEALWAGTVEPRIMELLPAVLVKKPQLLRLPKELPDDVAAVIYAIRHGKPAPSFRGVAPDRYLPWVTKVGRKGKSPSVLKSFRFKHEDPQLSESDPASLLGPPEGRVDRFLGCTALKVGSSRSSGMASCSCCVTRASRIYSYRSTRAMRHVTGCVSISTSGMRNTC
jgi:hypothetical protein